MKMQRRRLIQICAAAVPMASLARFASAGTTLPTRQWQGTAMGAQASLVIAHPDPNTAMKLIEHARSEIARIEQIFSLYRDDSELVRLNRDGHLDRPSPDMLALFSLVDGIHQASGGRFDPSIQAAWRRLAQQAGQTEQAPVHASWHDISYAPDRVQLRKAGMALSFNGIAQGFASDRVAQLLRGAGLHDVLVNVGEIVAIGHRPDGRAWQIGLAEHGDDSAQETIGLSNQAIATSSPDGPLGRVPARPRGGHIIDPRTGQIAQTYWRRLSVIHPSAAVADGLSTGLMLCPADQVAGVIARFRNSRVIAVDRAGQRQVFA